MEKGIKAARIDHAFGDALYNSERIITVASNFELSRPSHVQRLAIATVEKGIPRRKLPDWIAETIARFDGRIVWATGIEFTFSELEIYDVFGVKKDPSQRWSGDFYKFSVTPPKQIAQTRVIERLRFIDLAFRIAHPERADLIAK